MTDIRNVSGIVSGTGENVPKYRKTCVYFMLVNIKIHFILYL